jgi:DHA1 family tetracycline resistance protein-like MFS transporter
MRFFSQRLNLLYAILLVDVVIGTAIGPVVPTFVQGPQHPELWLAVGNVLFLGVQLFSAPLLGRLSDGYGRRPVFILSALGTLAANLLLLLRRIGFYFGNRLSDGVTNGMYSAVNAALTDLSTPARLFRNLGLAGSIISLGFVVGPMLVGLLLTVFDVLPTQQATYVIRLAVGLAVLNVGLSWWLPETHLQPSGVRGAELRTELVRTLNPLTLWTRLQIKEAVSPGIRRLIMMQVVLTLSLGYHFYLIPYISLGALQLDGQGISYFFVFFGSLSIGINCLFFNFFGDRINQQRAIGWLALGGVPVLAGYGLVGSSQPLLYGVVVLDCLTLSLIPGLLEGLLAQRTTPADRGEVLGLNQAFQGIASFLTTLIYGALSLWDLRAPWGWFTICLAVVAILSRKHQQNID